LYGIQLTAAEIATRALADTGKTAASDLTIVEKSIAGAELASEKYGSDAGGDGGGRTKNAAVQAESLKASFKEAIEQIGVPLVAPVLDLLIRRRSRMPSPSRRRSENSGTTPSRSSPPRSRSSVRRCSSSQTFSMCSRTNSSPR
jgi:hypothetical protein